MDGLRWLLLVVGLFVVAGVYFYTRVQRDRKTIETAEETDPANRVEPSFGGIEDSPDSDTFDQVEGDAGEISEAPVPAGEQKIVTLRVIARNSGAFAGDELVLSLRGIGMRHGKFGIFHRFEGSDEENIIFSAASLVEPGSFDMANIKEQKIPGISLFMVLPGPIDGAEGFDLMITASRALAQTLDAELLDETGSTLSIQRERYMREEIIQHQHSLAVV
ncbi:MAG: cell division protein ZipA [Woeseia sp.]|jgi:cell division protein ZipA|nr:cell division protein ZipA [Woeseia sp.]